jgi:hypothetical protein
MYNNIPPEALCNKSYHSAGCEYMEQYYGNLRFYVLLNKYGTFRVGKAGFF